MSSSVPPEHLDPSKGYLNRALLQTLARGSLVNDEPLDVLAALAGDHFRPAVSLEPESEDRPGPAALSW
jgi:hypothetical protein